MTEEEVLQMLRSVGAVSQGHFLLSSGRHSDIYAEKFRALEWPEIALSLGRALAERFEEADVVLAPAVGGVVLGFVTAHALGTRSIFAERMDSEMQLRRGFQIHEDERVVVVEDIITTGRSIREVLALVPPNQLAGIGCLVDRSGGTPLPRPVEALTRLDATSWDPGECPLCAKGVELVSPGSRYLATG